jgi:hypothetical protein
MKKDRGPSELPTILWIICYRSSRLLRESHLPPPLPGVLHFVRFKYVQLHLHNSQRCRLAYPVLKFCQEFFLTPSGLAPRAEHCGPECRANVINRTLRRNLHARSSAVASRVGARIVSPKLSDSCFGFLRKDLMGSASAWAAAKDTQASTTPPGFREPPHRQRRPSLSWGDVFRGFPAISERPCCRCDGRRKDCGGPCGGRPHQASMGFDRIAQFRYRLLSGGYEHVHADFRYSRDSFDEVR